MKAILLILVLLASVSCGKKQSNSSAKDKVANKIEELNLANITLTENTLNGVTKLQFMEGKNGLIELYLHYGMGYGPLLERYDTALFARFDFKNYKQIDEDIIELLDVSRNLTYVRNCEYCNSLSVKNRFLVEFDKYYYDLFNNKDTIKVKIVTINTKKHYILIDVAGLEPQ